MNTERKNVTAMIVEGQTRYFDDAIQPGQPVEGAPTFRDILKAAIESANGDAERASIAVCLVLQDELELSNRGYFDDDPVMQKVLVDEADLSTPSD